MSAMTETDAAPLTNETLRAIDARLAAPFYGLHHHTPATFDDAFYALEAAREDVALLLSELRAALRGNR